MTNTLDVSHLTLAFQDKTQLLTAVEDANFSLKKGKTLALLGESGCGKSLTSLALMRLLPIKGVYHPDSTVTFGEQDVLTIEEQAMRRLRGGRMGMIFQEPMTALNPVLSIGNQLAEALRQHHHLSNGALKKRMLGLLKDVEIDKPEVRLKQFPHQLSGGQKQRIVIAMALAGQPDVLIADEPTTALDVTIQTQILNLLKKLQEQYHMSLLLITHDLGVVKAMADEICIMYAGQVIETASVEQFFSQPLHPYSQQLLAAVPSLSDRKKHLQAIPGQVPPLDAMPTGCRYHPRCAHAFDRCASDAPLLQPGKLKAHSVRCHLYPTHDSLPPLPKEKRRRQVAKPKNADIVLSVEDMVIHFEHKRQGFSRKKPITHAVNHLSFSLSRGKTLALVGESGCGKSTTAKALLGLQPINQGTVRFEGQDITSLSRKALRQYYDQIQIIFQDPYASMNPRMTIADILAEGMLAKGIRGPIIQEKQLKVLDQVGLPQNSLGRYPHQFSGGQKQRISIARALLTEPKILVCDEPTSALDVSVQAQILNLLKAIQQDFGLSYLFITHNMGVVSYMADDVLVMRQGKAVETGPWETIYKSPKHDYTKALLGAVLSV